VTRYASVYPLVTARALAREFTYEVADDVRLGAVVEVRFGNAKRRGVVTQVDVAPPKGIETSAVERVVEELPKPLVELALWIAEYYGSTPGRAFALVAPVQRKARGERPQPAERDGLSGEAEPAELSATQRAALDRIVGALDAGQSANFLLYGATGSGKTEVYLQACAVALERGRGVGARRESPCGAGSAVSLCDGPRAGDTGRSRLAARQRRTRAHAVETGPHGAIGARRTAGHRAECARGRARGCIRRDIAT